MPTVAEEYDVVIGVDTHAATHTMSLVSGPTWAIAEQRTFPTSPAGLNRAVHWVQNRTTDCTVLVVVEGSGSYGALLVEQLTQAQITVAEAPSMPAAGPRGVGKDDTLDSARIARAVLGLPRNQLCWPRASGVRTAIRVLVAARQQMAVDRTRTINALTALVRSVNLAWTHESH